MTNRLRVYVSFVIVIVGLCIQARSTRVDDCEGVRELLLSLKVQMGGALPGYRQILEEAHEVGLSTNATFVTMSQLVKANWTNVVADLDSITTNRNERLVVLYAGVGAGETNFLSRIDCLADMALSNRVSIAELRFYKAQCGILDHNAASSLVRRYQEPSVSNLIMKLDAAGAYPQGVSNIFRGEAKELYFDAVHDGLISSP